MIRRIAVIAVIAVIALLAGSRSLATPNAVPSPVNSLLLAALAAPATVSYAGVVQVLRVGDREAQASVYRIEHRAPALTRRVYTTPATLAGETIVSRGDIDFAIDPKRHRIVETRNDAIGDRVAFNDNFALLRANYLASKRGEQDFDGRETVDVALTNKYSGQLTMMVRIDRQSKLVLDKQEFAPDGSLVSEVRFEEVRYAGAFPESDFALPKAYPTIQGPRFGEPSKNPDVVVRSAGFATREPKGLPEGFSPVEGNLVEIQGVRTLHLLYSDGIRSVSLFENVNDSTIDMTRFHPQPTSIGGRQAQYAEIGAMELLAWSDGSLHYALVGDLELAELQRIAASIAP
ncbi:MAG: hypothetical protein WA814_02720 [Candidatus Baltobacteraceae bacterium]